MAIRISGFTVPRVICCRVVLRRLAPVYDLVTTSVYLPKDSMALTLNGTTKWPNAKELQRLGETRMGATPARVRPLFERTAAAIADTSKEVRGYMNLTENSWR